MSNTQEDLNITLEGNKLETVNDYLYLGQQISAYNDGYGDASQKSATQALKRRYF